MEISINDIFEQTDHSWIVWMQERAIKCDPCIKFFVKGNDANCINPGKMGSSSRKHHHTFMDSGVAPCIRWIRCIKLESKSSNRTPSHNGKLHHTCSRPCNPNHVENQSKIIAWICSFLSRGSQSSLDRWNGRFSFAQKSTSRDHSSLKFGQGPIFWDSVPSKHRCQVFFTRRAHWKLTGWNEWNGIRTL